MEEATAQDLYEVYVDAMREQNIEVDPWDMLAESDKYAWEVVATHVRVNS